LRTTDGLVHSVDPMRDKVLLIALYSPPQYYPPTLNAVEFLAEQYDRIYIIYRNYDSIDWSFPPNVETIATGRKMKIKAAERLSLGSKMFFFVQYTWRLFMTVIRVRPHTWLIYEYMPILSLFLLNPFLRRPHILWYHNHDVGDPDYIRKWSISWFAWKSERWLFPRLTLFSLPSLARKIYFPMEIFKGTFFFLPNFPARKIYNTMVEFNDEKDIDADDLKLLYQGSISRQHGFEEIISILNRRIAGKGLRLVLKGFISDKYLKELQELAAANKVGDRLIYLPPSGYKDVIKNSFHCHIGIGIYMKNDIMNNTLGTASNKIYEYAAAGLPVLVYDNEHFRAALTSKNWAIFTDATPNSLIKCLEDIVGNYRSLSAAARKDFIDQLCFEYHFDDVVAFLGRHG